MFGKRKTDDRKRRPYAGSQPGTDPMPPVPFGAGPDHTPSSHDTGAGDFSGDAGAGGSFDGGGGDAGGCDGGGGGGD